MSKDTPAVAEREVFESVVDAYFHFTMEQEGMTMQQAITQACKATDRNYNSSMYTRWREKTPQQDVLKFMQHYVSQKIVRQLFPKAKDSQIKVLINNLSVPVTDEENRNIAKHFAS
jgi:transcriptional accessory protein Tex/SPT6